MQALTLFTSGIAVAVVIFIVVRVFRSFFANRTDGDDQLRGAPVQIAHIVQKNVARDSSGASFPLLIFSVVSLYKYFTAVTTDQEIVALLLWIGNSTFWGAIFIGAMISHSRTSIVYRDMPPAERQEPRM
jgi:hypothetical protein